MFSYCYFGTTFNNHEVQSAACHVKTKMCTLHQKIIKMQFL